MSREALAGAVFVSESLVRAWENGRRLPQPDHLAKVEKALGTGGFLLRLREDLVKHSPAPEWMGRWLQIEQQATSLLTYEPLLIPGLLQTPEYARSVITSSGRPVEDLDEQVQARMERQKILHPDNSLVFVAIIDETVLYRAVGGAEAMHAQLVKLLEVAEQPNVMVQIVPEDAGAYPGLAGGFAIASMDGQEFAYVDDAFSGDVLENPDDVATMKRIWETLRVEALSSRQSIELIRKAMQRWAS